MAYHPTKPWAVLSRANGAAIVELNTGAVLTQMVGHTSDVRSVAFSPDGMQVLTGAGDSVVGSENTARLWDAATGAEIRAFEGHSSIVHSVAFSPDGTQVLTGSSDSTARLWDAATGAQVRAFEGHTGRVNSVAFSPDGTQVLTGAGGFDTTARLWDASTGAEIRAFEGDSPVYSVVFSLDGTQVLTGTGWPTPAARLWDASTGDEIRAFEGHTSSIHSVAFSPDGTQVLTGSSDNTARLWDATTGAQIRAFEGHWGWVWSVAFSPDGTQVLTGSPDFTVRLLDASTGAEIRTFAGHTNDIWSVAFSPDGMQVLTGSRDETARLWDAFTGAETHAFEGHWGWVRSVAFSPDGTQLLTGAEFVVRLWDADTGDQLRTFGGGGTGRVYSVAFSPDGTQVLTGSSDNTARLWDATTGAQIRAFEGHSGSVNSVAFSPDGTQVLTGSSDGTARLWDATTGDEVRAFEGHTSSVNSVVFSPDGTQVLTGGDWPDNTARLWDATTGDEIRAFEGHTSGVPSVAFSPDGTQILTGSWDNTARLWDTATGDEILAFEGHTIGVRSVAFSPNSTHVLTGSNDRTALLWELPTNIFAITPDTTGPTNADAVAFSVRFTQPVFNFENESDLLITHDGTAHTGVTITGGPSVYTVTVEGITGDGSFTLAVNTDSNIENSAGNPLESSVTSEPVLIDNTPPVVSFTTDFGNGPGQDFTTSIMQFPLQGTTDPDTVEVWVNNEMIAYIIGWTTWDAEIDLIGLGPVAELTVIAIDTAGNKSEPVTITITYDPLHDADGNGLTDLEEWEIRDTIPIDPLDPLLPRVEWFVSAVDGLDVPAIDGGGTPESPWQSIGYAMEQLRTLAREHFPLRILLDDTANFVDDVGSIALYEEAHLAFIPFVTLEPADPDGGRIHIRPSSTGATPVIRAAADSTLRGVVVRPALAPDQARPLLEIDNVPFTVEGVTFDGLLRQNSTGIDISGLNSSDSIIAQCRFFNLGTGIRSTNSAVAVSDNTFENISANSSSSVAIAIGFTVLPTKQGVEQTPVLGRVDRILETGFNRFRGLPSGANAIEFVNVPIGVTSAQYNDWGVYTEEQIRARISAPFKDGGADAVDIFPFIPQDKAIIPGAITGVVLDAQTNAPIPLNAAPGVIATDTLSAMAGADGLFFFDVLPEGMYNLFGRATNYDDSPTRSVRVVPGRTTEAPRFLLEGDGVGPGTGIPGDVNGTGVVNAVDVQLVINAALGIDIGEGMRPDINGDGLVNAVDVQLVINAALGVEINL